MKMRAYILILLFLLILSSCAVSDESVAFDCEIFYTDIEQSITHISESRRLYSENLQDAANDAFELLKSAVNKHSQAVIPRGISLESLEIANNIACIKLTDAYAKLMPAEQSILNSCITNTLCSIPGIDSIFISCDGTSSKILSPENFVTEKPYAYYSTQVINLYFADTAFSNLIRETTSVSLGENDSLEEVTFSRLLAGPNTDTATGTIPEGVKVNKILVQDGVCLIDLSREFVDNATHTQPAEAVTLFSVVNTMTELPLIDSVKFLIDGQTGYGYTYFDISKPLTNASNLLK